MINRYVAPGLFGEHGRPKLQPLPADRPSFNLSSHSSPGNAAIIDSLLKRISVLEGRHSSAASADEQNSSNILPIRESSGASSTGQFVKSKFYGQSHWMNSVEPYGAFGDKYTTINQNTNKQEINKSSELYATVADVKRMARIIKTSRMFQPSISSEVRDSIPPKSVCDSLVDCYLRTFEGIFRVLHVPSFRREYEGYWAGTVAAKPSVILKILLVCAIGSPFYTATDHARLRVSSATWIQAATEWLNGPHVKSRLNMAGLQIQILVLLARQVCNIDGDHVWIPAGALLRTAMHLGLHRDPSHFGKISIYHGEMRRRLWATVLEITAQSSLDMGMPPMVSANDYDTKSPANVNDEDIGEGIHTLDAKPHTVFTDSSIQIAFTQTLPIRLEIVRLINNLRFDLSYSDVLQLGTELTGICREKTIFLKSALAANHNVTPFQIKMSDTLVRRFVLCLHRPFFSKANADPQYHYSRKICLDTSLAIYAPATELLPGEEDDWTRMTHRCVGFFKSFFLYAMSTVYYELNSQINERREDSALFAPLISSSSSPSSRLLSLPAQFQDLRSVLETARKTTVARLRHGETNAKGVAFLTCALARIDALVSGADADLAVLEAAKKSVRQSSDIMREAYREEYGEDIDLSPRGDQLLGKEHAREEGANNAPGSSFPKGITLNDNESGALPTFEGGLEVWDMLDDGIGNMGMDMDLDFNAYLQGQSRGIDIDYHFGRSPEQFYNFNGWAAPVNYGMNLNEFTS